MPAHLQGKQGSPLAASARRHSPIQILASGHTLAKRRPALLLPAPHVGWAASVWLTVRASMTSQLEQMLKVKQLARPLVQRVAKLWASYCQQQRRAARVSRVLRVLRVLRACSFLPWPVREAPERLAPRAATTSAELIRSLHQTEGAMPEAPHEVTTSAGRAGSMNLQLPARARASAIQVSSVLTCLAPRVAQCGWSPQEKLESL
mmetsp:Transcript_48946/g.116401  ORF Transcript_48946/g.116401 Transcript_48946/m.116401 type:complete len:205 (-) Transcript_48946:760-1374(-)